MNWLFDFKIFKIFKMSFAIKPRTRAKVQCFCDKCKGELVDPRMKMKHEELMLRKIK